MEHAPEGTAAIVLQSIGGPRRLVAEAFIIIANAGIKVRLSDMMIV